MQKNKVRIIVGVSVGFVALAALFLGLYFGGVLTGSIKVPLVTPPVKQNVPAGFGGNAQNGFYFIKQFVQETFSQSIDDRFFTGGPTDVFTLLGNVDSRINSFNGQGYRTGQCFKSPYVYFNFTNFANVNVPFLAQCADTWNDNGNTAFQTYGEQNGTFYLFMNGGQQRLAAIQTVNASNSSATTVHIWFSVGQQNPLWDSMSYGVGELISTPDGSFEMTVAGIGFGFCGAQLKSNGHVVYLVGSADMGTCDATQYACVYANDTMTTATTCGSEGVGNFVLTSIGRQASNPSPGSVYQQLGASNYPGGSNNFVVLLGNNTDSVFFGPGTVPAGL